MVHVCVRAETLDHYSKVLVLYQCIYTVKLMPLVLTPPMWQIRNFCVFKLREFLLKCTHKRCKANTKYVALNVMCKENSVTICYDRSIPEVGTGFALSTRYRYF